MIPIPKIPESRPTEVHKKPCKNCPSAHHPRDPEAQDILDALSRGEVSFEDVVFPCAWRPEKICRGVYDSASLVRNLVEETL